MRKLRWRDVERRWRRAGRRRFFCRRAAVCFREANADARLQLAQILGAARIRGVRADARYSSSDGGRRRRRFAAANRIAAFASRLLRVIN